MGEWPNGQSQDYERSEAQGEKDTSPSRHYEVPLGLGACRLNVVEAQRCGDAAYNSYPNLRRHGQPDSQFHLTERMRLTNTAPLTENTMASRNMLR